MSDRRHLPNRRGADICTVEHEACRYRVTFGRFANGALAEIFLDVGKPDSTLQAQADDSAVLVSLLLQHGVEPRIIAHSTSGPIRTALDLWLGRAPQ